MADELEKMKHKLFTEWKVDNVKLFPGPGKNRDAMPEDIAAQMAAVLDELARGELKLIDDFKDDD